MSLPILKDEKDNNYNSILFIVKELIKIAFYKSHKTIINVIGQV